MFVLKRWVIAMASKACSGMINHLTGGARDKPFQPNALMESA